MKKNRQQIIRSRFGFENIDLSAHSVPCTERLLFFQNPVFLQDLTKLQMFFFLEIEATHHGQRVLLFFDTPMTMNIYKICP